MTQFTKQLMIEVNTFSTEIKTFSAHTQSNYLELSLILAYLISRTASCFQQGANPANRLLVE